jgi:hypothetical protein
VTRRGEQGNVTILMIAALAFAALCCVAVARLGSATAHKARADTAADAAALAAADALAAGGTSADAELAARRLAAANGAVLLWCACAGRAAEVTVAFGEAQARARAEIDDPWVPSMTPRSATAAALSRYSFQFPHFGDCTHEGQPSSHEQPAMSSSVARTCRAAASNASSAMPAPPG